MTGCSQKLHLTSIIRSVTETAILSGEMVFNAHKIDPLMHLSPEQYHSYNPC